MLRKIYAVLLFVVSFSAAASVPEPSFVILGIVESAGVQVKQAGMTVSASRSGVTLADIELNQANQFSFSLEVPLEAAVGARDAAKARVGDVIDLKVSGEIVANVLVSERGAFRQQNIPLPQGFDSDGDGVLDSIEVANGSNPNDPNDPVQFGSLDIDGDGISNGQEFLTGTYDPNGDYDGDGFSNTDEYTLSKDPKSASDFPSQYAEFGHYSPLHVHSDAQSFLKSEDGSDMVWDEQVNGVPVSIVPAKWNIDVQSDLLISTDQGKLFFLQQTESANYSQPQLISLFSVPASDKLFIGFANFDGINSEELWAYSKAGQKLYVFDRKPTGQPHGQSVWLQLDLAGISGDVEVADLDLDGVPDVIATGVELSVLNRTAANTMAFYKGAWDGVNFSLAAPVLIASETHISDSGIQLVPNLNEAGYDQKKDLLIKSSDQKYYFDLSFNGLKQAATAKSLLQTVSALQSPATSSQVTHQLAQLDTGSASDAFIFASLTGDGHTDLIQYTGALAGNVNKFRLLKGFGSSKDSDLDGIPDYRDLAMNDKDIPLPRGDVDFDGDGIKYAADGNHSGQEDADGDGIKDGFELIHGLNPLDASDKDSDIDQDGRTALQESLDGTDPTDPASVATQEAQLITSVAAYASGASDLLLAGTDVIVSSANSKSVKVYDSGNLSNVRTLESSDKNGVNKILSLNNMLVMGTVSGSVEVWDLKQSTKLIEFDRSNASVTDMAISGNQLYSLHADGDVYQWDLEKLVHVHNWHVYDGVLTSIFANGDQIYIQSSAPEKIMFVWDMTTRQQIYTITGNADCCAQVVAEQSGNTMILANSFSGSGIYAMNINNYNASEIVKGIDASALKAVGGEVYVGRKSGVIDWYSAEDGTFIGRVAAPHTYVRKIELINGGFVSLHSDGKVYFWEHK